MGLKNIYTLDFTHPPKSTEVIRYDITKSFFEEIEGSVIRDANVALEFSIVPLTECRFQLKFVYDGEVVVDCDRCLMPLTLPMYVEEEVKLTIGDHFDDENDEEIILDAQDPVYDFSWIIYELLALHLPIQRMHDIEDCDPEFVKYLVNEIPEDSDEARTPGSQIWQSLRDRIDNKNNN